MIITPINIISKYSYLIKTLFITENAGASVAFWSEVLRVARFQGDKENSKSISQYYLLLLSIRKKETFDWKKCSQSCDKTQVQMIFKYNLFQWMSQSSNKVHYAWPQMLCGWQLRMAY